jgi:hypothetical protein
MSSTSVAIQSARVCLGDLNGITWTDAILFPNLQEAYRSMLLALRAFSVDVIKKQTSVFLVPALTMNISSLAAFPSGLLTPLSLLERVPGGDLNSFQPMYEVSYAPVIDMTQNLNFWAWVGEQLLVSGATTDREVLLRYKGTLTPPQTLNDPLNFIMAENYLGPKTAAIALSAISKDGSKWDARAELALYDIIRSNITEDQRPTRRRAYRSSFRGYGPIGASVISGGSSGGSTLPITWILPTTPPDGIRTTFNFFALPKYISWNGLNQFLGTGYTLVVIGGVYQVTFIDSLGATLTPDAGDDIRAEIN